MTGKCICPRECDCELPPPYLSATAAGFIVMETIIADMTWYISDSCAEHNDIPVPVWDCPAEVHWWEEESPEGT